MSFRPSTQTSPPEALRRAAFLTEEASKMSARPEPAGSGPARKDWRAEIKRRPRRTSVPVRRKPLRGTPVSPSLSKLPAWSKGLRKPLRGTPVPWSGTPVSPSLSKLPAWFPGLPQAR